MVKIYLCVVFVVTLISEGALSSNCPDVTLVENFTLSQLTGIWHEIGRSPFLIQDNQICNYANFKEETNEILDVEIVGFLTPTEKVANDYESVWMSFDHIKMTPVDGNPANLEVTFNEVVVSVYPESTHIKTPLESDSIILIKNEETMTLGELSPFLSGLKLSFKIIDTDHTSYWVAQGCVEEGNEIFPPGTEYAWIGSQDEKPDSEILIELGKKLPGFSPSISNIGVTEQVCDNKPDISRK